jgi:hypothetical protein
MFLGHYAIGLAAKRAAPGTSLGVHFAAVQFLDLLWPIFLLTGLERVEIDPGNTAFTPLDFIYYPFTHSLLTTAGWAVLFALVYGLLTRYRTGAVVVGLGVLSHWLLDAVVHRPDLPLYPGSSVMVGLGLWNSVPVTIALEAVLFAAGVWIYLRATRPRNRKGMWVLWSLLAFLVLIAIGNALSPPPEDARSLAFVALAAWLFPLWAYWADRNRAVAPIR